MGIQLVINYKEWRSSELFATLPVIERTGLPLERARAIAAEQFDMTEDELTLDE